MALIIDLTAEEEARLATVARRKGIEPQECARQLLTEHLPGAEPDEARDDPTLALFARWEEEDAGKTPKEITEENRMWEEFEKSINETRKAMGMRQL